MTKYFLLFGPFLPFFCFLLFYHPAILSSSGLLRQHCVCRRADPKQPRCPATPEWGEDSGDKPPADRPCRGAIRLFQYTRWPRGGPSPVESPQLPGEKKTYIIDCPAINGIQHHNSFVNSVITACLENLFYLVSEVRDSCCDPLTIFCKTILPPTLNKGQ